MNYIIYDLEFNQKNNGSTEIGDNSIATEINNSSIIPFEIIQIGALKLNEKFETISTFNTLIKPTIYKTIHPFIEDLTGINNSKVDLCKNFIQTYEDFMRFIGSEETVLCVWGTVDIKELLRNILFHKLCTSSISRYYIDIQKYASKYLKAPQKSKIGLRNAIELLNIPIEGEFHDAFNDAYYTTEVFKLIYDDNVEPMVYNPAPSTRVSKPKEKVDITSLINQFQKIYNRDMSEEEESIIKLAYMMGKTRQFIL